MRLDRTKSSKTTLSLSLSKLFPDPYGCYNDNYRISPGRKVNGRLGASFVQLLGLRAMCDLLGVSSRQPVTIEMSFTKLMERAKTHNPDGWGSAFYRGSDAYIFREPRPGNGSRLADYLAKCGIASQLIISHIRKATQGEISIQNTHPFSRELNGRLHSFAFNGDIPAVYDIPLPSKRFMSIGDSDAEYAFCHILNKLAAGDTEDSTRTAGILHHFGLLLSEMGPTNFLYSDSHCLYVFASRRRHPDGEYPPGVHYLCRQCRQTPASLPYEGIKLESTNALPQEVVLFSSVPLSDEAWTPMPENQLIAARNGQISQILSAA